MSTHSNAVLLFAAMQASLEPRSGSGNELSVGSCQSCQLYMHCVDTYPQKLSQGGGGSSYWGYSSWALASTIVALSQHGSKAGSNDRPAKARVLRMQAREQWNSGRRLPLRGVYPTPSHIGASGPPETTCQQGQVARGGWSSMGKSKGKKL